MAEYDGNNTTNRGNMMTPSIGGSSGAAIMSPAYKIDGTLYDNVPPIKYPPAPPKVTQNNAIEEVPANVKQ